MRITLKTGNGDKPAPDITDPLLSSTDSMIARGKAELYGSVDAYQQGVNMPLQSLVTTGEIGEIVDSKYGETYRARVESVAIDITESGIDLKIDLERIV